MFKLDLGRLETAVTKRNKQEGEDSSSSSSFGDMEGSSEQTHAFSRHRSKSKVDVELNNRISRYMLEDDPERHFDIGWPHTPRSLRQYLGLEVKMEPTRDEFLSDTFYNFVKAPERDLSPEPFQPDVEARQGIPNLKRFTSSLNISAAMNHSEDLPDDVMYSKLIQDCKLTPQVMEDGVERLHAVPTPRKRPSRIEQKDFFKRLSSRTNPFSDSMRALLVPLTLKTRSARPLSAHVPVKGRSRPSSPDKGYTSRTQLTDKPASSVWTITRSLISKKRQDSSS